MFRFEEPQYLYLLIFIPILIAVYVWYRADFRRRKRKFAQNEIMQILSPDASNSRARHKFELYLLAVLLLIIAAARPQFGSKLKEEKRTGREIMLAVDVSNSMLAQDIEPTRLDRTKFAIERLIEQLDEDRIGVIVFAGDAYVQLPITSDYATAASFVRNLSPTMISKQGTAIGAALEMATNSFSSSSKDSRVVILISDGENHQDNPLAAAELAAQQGIKVYVIGIGTPEGSPIKIGDDFLKDNEGNIVVTKLDEKILEQIAVTTGGTYIRANNHSIGLQEIINRINELEKKELSTMVFEEYNEQYQWFVGAALLLLLLDFLMYDRRNKLISKMNIFTRNNK